MTEPKKHISKRVLLTRIICGILAFLMIGSIAYYSAVFIFLS